jgi:predicted transposase YdaD
LNEEEEEIYMAEAEKHENAEEIMELTVSYEERGRKKGIEDVALRLLQEGADVKFIMKITDLTLEEIEEIRDNK